MKIAMQKAAVLLFTFALAISALAQTPTTVPAGWPTAQFAAAKDPGVQKSFQILNQMIRALGGDAWLNVAP